MENDKALPVAIEDEALDAVVGGCFPIPTICLVE